MNIGANFTLRFAKNLPDLAQNNIRIGAIMWSFRFGTHDEPNQR
jgi:hypothetical protein